MYGDVIAIVFLTTVHWRRSHAYATLYDRFTQTPAVCQHDQTSAAAAVHGYMFVLHAQCG